MRKDDVQPGDIVLIQATVMGKHTGLFPIDVKILGKKRISVSNADIVMKVNQEIQ